MPAHVWDSDPLTFWRERILFFIAFTASALGLVALIPSLLLASLEGRWGIVLLDTSAYLTALTALLGRRFPLKVRAWIVCLMLYLLGDGLMFMLGPTGAGYIWLFGASVIMAAILGFKAAVWSLAFNLLSLVGVGFYIAYGHPHWPLYVKNPLVKWTIMTLNFMMINTLVTLTTAMIVNGLNRALAKEQEIGFNLRKSERRFRTLVENAPLGIVSIDRTGRIIDANPKLLEIIAAQSKKNALKINVFQSPQVAKTSFPKRLKDCLNSGVCGGFEETFTSSWGKTTFLRYMVSPLTDSGGRTYAALSIIEDITEARGRDEQLRRAQKMESLGLLAGGVAHDLNNVLSGIVSYPELILLDLPAESPLKKPIKTIQQSGHRAAEIVQDLLTLARRGVVNMEVQNMNRIVSDYLTSPELEKLMSFHPAVEIETRLAEDLFNVACSAIHIKKTVMNLVTNAAEAQPDGGCIVIRTENRHVDRPVEGDDNVRKGDYVVLIVGDKGVGIPPEDLKRIFEPFYTKKIMGRSGTGLGMAVVWATVQDHEGTIDVTSVEGEGTVFELYFPATRQKPVTDEAAVPLDVYMGAGETVLIVDDIEEQRMLATQILQRLNYHPASVSSGEAAIAYIENHPVDVILLDMIMEPGIDGLDTWRRIVDLRSGQKAIIVSGYSETERVKKAIELGARQVVKKPYTIEKIGLAVKQALAD
ncbi:ATP-binding protein [uncultured Desulfosarcina sp.]|uniref:hybrid sensor histidine kinase/response regulator n=1 Tax=uncultured Desulfosarcina sp. TaxID=218289 RepID=UPI0029C7163C|nr:ATP-binding protein [uncultured Desulfosarcina sp.]